MRSHRRPWWLVGAGMLLPALLIAACSSSGGSSTSGSSPAASSGTSSSTASAALTGSPIKIGFAVAITGLDDAQGAAAVPTAQAWAKWVNANGGIDGHPVQVVVQDTQSSPTAGLAAMKTLVGQSGISAVMLSDTASEAPVGSYAAGQNIAVIGANGFDTGLWGAKPDFFSNWTLQPYTTYGVVQAAKSIGATKVGTIVCAEIASCATFGQVVQSVTKNYGVTYTGEVTASASAASYTAQCLSLMQKGSNMILVAVPPAEVVRIAQNCIQQGYKGYFGLSSIAFDQKQVASVPGMKMVLELSSFPWWSSAPAVQQFRDAIAKYAPGTDYENNNATGTWAALELFRQVAGTITGSITRQSVIDAYNKVSSQTLGGLLPEPITFTAGQPSPIIKASWLATYTVGDADPTTITNAGTNCNNATGDLISTCP
jgi:branched-chain amino acid transport system substrate-binding protein